MKKISIPNETLRQARLARNWTQAYLAGKLGVDEQTVRSWERGTRTPSLEYRRRLCKIFSATPEQLGLALSDAPAQSSQEFSSPVAPAISPALNGPHRSPTSAVASGERSRRDKNRSRMLKRVSTTWIEGVLRQSLHHAAWIALGLQEQPDALANPWHLAVQETRLPPRPLPEGTSIVQVYDDADGQLLILGEPGAGKTTLLLSLACELLKRAEQDEYLPLPVIFNLSSWAVKQPPLTIWFVEELASKYHVPRKVAQDWLEANQLIVLLDGLDEVAEAVRSACVGAINRYQEEQETASLVVCCRKAEYFAQSTRVILQRAVLVQPLTIEQIDAYLSYAGEQLETVRRALREDAELQEMVRTPLMLDIVSLAYQGEEGATFMSAGSLEKRRQHVFGTYVRRMLGRRGAVTHYPPEQTIRWLAWLARQLTRQSQTEFHIERIQPDWLPDERVRRCYRQMIIRLVFGLQVFVSAALFAWLRGGQKGTSIGVGVGLLGKLGGGPGNSILGWMAPGLGGALEGGGSLGILFALVAVLVILLIGVSPFPALSLRAIQRGLTGGIRSGLLIGTIIGLFSDLIFSWTSDPARGWVGGLSAGLFSGLLTGLMTGLCTALRDEQEASSQQDNQPLPANSGALRTRFLQRLLDTLIFSLWAIVGNGGVYALLAGRIDRNVLIYSAIVGLFYGVAFGFGGGTRLMQRLGEEIRPTETVSWSWRNIGEQFVGNVGKGLVVGLVVMVCVALAIGCASSFFFGPRYGLLYGLVYGCIVGLVGSITGILTGILNSGWSGSVLTEDQLFRPNEGIRRSLRNAAFAASLFGLLGGLASGLICGFAFGWVGGLPGWPILGAGFAIIFAIVFALDFIMIYRGSAWMEHYLLRWYLWRAGSLPWNYAVFLNYASERILLRRIGGGYLFSHRLLQDYFATLDTTTPCCKKASSEPCFCAGMCKASNSSA